MESLKFQILAFAVLVFYTPVARSWGFDGHSFICRLAQPRLSKPAAAMSELLPSSAGNDLSSLCLWVDLVKFHYQWSRPLHYINTPDEVCSSYQYKRDCKEENGVEHMCVAGAMNNYTSQLLSYGNADQSFNCN